MGLDMYAYRVRKLNNEEIAKIKETRTLPEDGTIDNGYISVREDEIDSSGFKDLKPFATLVTVLNHYVDMDRVKEDHGISEDMVCVGNGWGSDSMSWMFRDNNKDELIDVKLTKKQIEEKYSYSKTENEYVVHYENLKYWRKDYKLEDKLYMLYEGNIENCGYHKCNPDMIEAMALDNIKPNEDIFYHEWY